MYICVCNAVRESDIHLAVENGVRNMRELIVATGCSTACKKCATRAVEVLEAALQDRRPLLRVVASGRAA